MRDVLKLRDREKDKCQGNHSVHNYTGAMVEPFGENLPVSLNTHLGSEQE